MTVVSQGSRGRRWQGSLRWNVLAAAGLVGVLIVLLAWYLGPGLFGANAADDGTVATSTVTGPAPCTDPGAEETVQFEFDGKDRNGTLNSCGHDRGEQVRIEIPPGSASTGLISVASADIEKGRDDLRRPVGLVLVALSCLAGGVYAFLVARGPRRTPALA